MSEALHYAFVAIFKYPVVTITFVFILIRISFPMKASDGKRSNTLSGLVCTSVVIFMVCVMDTLNDTYTPLETTKTIAASHSQADKAKPGISRYLPSTSSTTKRSVTKEKYTILGLLLLFYAVLYLLSHRGKEIQVMGLRFATALRGKFPPMPDDDVIENYMVEALRESPTPETRQWAVQMMLAKKGIVSTNPNSPPTSTTMTKEESDRLPSSPPDFLKE